MIEFVLYVFVTYNNQVLHTSHERFTSAQTCQVAAEALKSQSSNYTSMQVRAVCVQR